VPGSGVQELEQGGSRASMVLRLAAQDLIVETLVDQEFREIEQRRLRARSLLAEQQKQGADGGIEGAEGKPRLGEVEDEGGLELREGVGEGGGGKGGHSARVKEGAEEPYELREHQDKMAETKRQRRQMFSALARRGGRTEDSGKTEHGSDVERVRGEGRAQEDLAEAQGVLRRPGEQAKARTAAQGEALLLQALRTTGPPQELLPATKARGTHHRTRNAGCRICRICGIDRSPGKGGGVPLALS